MACGAVGHRRHDEPVADEIPELNLQRLTDELEAAVDLAAALPDDTLTHLAAAIRDEIRRRAREGGNHDAIIEEAFQQAFGRDGLGAAPWVEGDVIVCPGATIDMNSPLTKRATAGQETTVIAITILSIEGFMIATNKMAKTKEGIVWKISVTLIRASSITPP